jgi:hypothetical protein
MFKAGLLKWLACAGIVGGQVCLGGQGLTCGAVRCCCGCLFSGGPGVPGAYAAERAEWGRDAEPALGRTQSGLIGEG